MQFRGPVEKGLKAARLSLWKGEEGLVVASGSQRSGWKEVGAWKLCGEW